MNNDDEKPQHSDDRTASDELREGLNHLFAAARKVAQGVEPHVSRTIEDAERALERVGREGEMIAGDVTREVATFATRLAEKLRAVSERTDEKPSSNDPKP
jgi:hypothetical protein